MTGKQKGNVVGELCPYCGRTFKRLKTHLNHCKMAPAVASPKSADTLSEDALLKAVVVKSKKKTAAATSRDQLSSSSQGKTESLSDLKTKNRNKKLVKPAEPITSTPLASPQTTNPASDSLSEDTGQIKRKWPGRSKQETEKEKLSAVLMETGRISLPKATALGKITLAANVLKGSTGGGEQREVTKATKLKNAAKSKASLRLPVEENGLAVPLTTAMASVQERTHKALHKPHTENDQHFNPSHLKPQIQTHFQEEVKASWQGRGKDLLSVKVPDSDVSYTYKVKTSVWDHIKGGLLSRKYGVPMTASLVGTKPQVGNGTTALTISLPQSVMNPQKAASLEGPFMKCADSSKPPQVTLLASQSDALSSNPRSLEWMSTVTAGYHGMEVYRPPGRLAQGHEQYWMKPSPAPLPPTPLPVPEVLGGSKRPQGPSSSLNSGGQAFSLSIVPLAERRFGDVTLNELLPWLADRTPQSPKEGLAILKNGWQWYYRRYIDVRKGGIGGVGMLIAGYCVLSYVWSYPHLKHERWRKYH
ncbi:uncharacterized protein si:dkey-21c1.4 isoform X1 [Alosa sapidissima]|uniref:uncharacterized protein si:dkey-21c1.4 isoform X1 n=1 Tax=Alosa sapidissima TaxID=34773 RepID=UPI001C080122|nr:uncharacterized protein si:dkey-21c1.4 isoform X1 [Alosa sapidissima]